MPGWKMKPRCPHCNWMLKLLSFEKIPPPGDYFHYDVKKEETITWQSRN